MPVSADLGDTLEDYVSALVKSGRYNSKSEVLREGIRLIQEREARLKVLDTAIAQGLADADAGHTIPAEEAFAKLRNKIEKSVKTG